MLLLCGQRCCLVSLSMYRPKDSLHTPKHLFCTSALTALCIPWTKRASSEALNVSFGSWHSYYKLQQTLYSMRIWFILRLLYWLADSSWGGGGPRWKREVKRHKIHSYGFSWVLPNLPFRLTVMDGSEVCACMSLSLHPSRLPVYKDNLTPANAMRHLAFECKQV